LHISLGLFLKFYELLLDDCAVLDAKIATRKAGTDEAAGDTDLDRYITLLREARKHHQLASSYLEKAQQTVGYATYLITAGALIHTEEAPNPIVVQLLQHAQDMQNKAKQEVHDHIFMTYFIVTTSKGLLHEPDCLDLALCLLKMVIVLTQLLSRIRKGHHAH